MQSVYLEGEAALIGRIMEIEIAEARQNSLWSAPSDATAKEQHKFMSQAQKTVRLEFENNTLMTIICGQHNQHLARIERALNVQMDSFGNQIKIGLPDKVELASKTFTSLYQQLSAQDNQDEISATLLMMCCVKPKWVNPATTPIDKSLFATT